MSSLIGQAQGHLNMYWDPSACSDLSRSKKNYPKLGSKGMIAYMSFQCRFNQAHLKLI